MSKEWISGSDGKNLKFKRETLLNYGMNRWGLNKTHSVGPTSELIRKCAPASFFIYSVKSGKKKKIYNLEAIEEIRNEIGRLQKA